MPSQKFARAPLWCAISLAFSLSIASPQADAAGLGRLTLQSGLGQPLRAELEVTSVSRDELPTLQVRVAPLAAFRAANLEYNPALSNLRFFLEKRPDGGYFVRINSPQPVNEPYIDLMVELTWATGRVIREYTVLLDPPSLRAQADVMAPAASASPTPAPAAAAPAPAPATSAAPAAAPTARPTTETPAAAAARPAPSAGAAAAEGTYVVKTGDTLGKIALQTKASAVSLDQMLVAMFRANPDAFMGKNMNRLRAGATLTIPSEAEAAGLAGPEVRKEVVAQSADFAAYKSRLAQAAGAAPVAAAAPAAAAGGGKVTTKVQEKGAPPPAGGDQLKIARTDAKGTAPAAASTAAAAAAAAKADEEAAKARALREQQERADQLKKTNEAIQKALEVQSKAGAAAQKQAEQKSAPAPTPAPVAAAPTKAEPVKAEPTKAEPVKAEPTKAEPMTAEGAPTVAPPPPAPVAAPAPPVKKAAPPPPPPQEESNIVADLLGNTTTQLGLAGIVALLAGLFGWSWYRKRRVERGDRFKETGEGLQANSLFGATGGQSVDTGTSTFNSSFIPAASQLDSNEVDPVAEADVYIAYGREEQAEDILKEALRLQPDRHAVRAKMMEIYARRGDKASFMAVAADLKERTGGVGEDWERAVKLGRTVDPAHPMFAGGTAEVDTGRGPTTGFRLDPGTKSGRPSTIGGGPTAGLDLSGLTAGAQAAGAGVPPLTRMVVDTKMSDTTMSVETKMPADTKMTGPTTTAAPTTQFQATLPAGPATTVGVETQPASDFGSLDFDLGPTKINLGPPTKMPTTEMPVAKDEDFFVAPAPRRVEPPAVADIDAALGDKYPAMAPTATGVGAIPDLDLNIPSTRMPTPPAKPPAPVHEPAFAVAAEALSRPTVVGKTSGVNTMMTAGMPDEASRLTANTDQATVPLIDFDLSAVSLDAATKRGETEPGSALAQQMATKLDLARGYIDLGVKDGARELLDEVMRDGTREQRSAAVELIKQIES
jgi:pilus assembly protein FimV